MALQTLFKYVKRLAGCTASGELPPPNPRAIDPGPRNEEETERIRARVAGVPWFHAFELVPGVVTPGHIHVNGREHMDSFRIPARLDGKSAIDVGSWDGYVAFELWRRGAKTVALDIQDPDRTGFNTAKEVLGAQVEYVRAGVQELPGVVGGRTFDLVMFLAVFNAVKDPIGAFEGVASIMHRDSVLYFEGECLHCYAEDGRGNPVQGRDLERLAASDVPLALCYPRGYKKANNWYVPNVACLRNWLTAAGLEVFELHPMVNTGMNPPGQRILGFARKVRDTYLPEHEIV